LNRAFFKKIYICYMSACTKEKFNADSPNTVVYPYLGVHVLYPLSICM
jgi:hypothetical protein